MHGPSRPDRTPPDLDPEIESILRNPDAMAWMGAHLDDLRRSVAQHRFRTATVWIALVVGLIAHVAGSLIGTSGFAEPFALLADLLYALGLATWTGTVVVALVEIIPQANERQILQAIDSVRGRGRRRSAGRARVTAVCG